MPISYEIIKNPTDHDSDDVVMNGKYRGFGYRGKEDGKIGLIRCPKCGKENYMPAVSEGKCVRCGFNANKLLI